MTDKDTDGKDYCEVYDEPRHQFHLCNEFTNLYEIFRGTFLNFNENTKKNRKPTCHNLYEIFHQNLFCA